MFPILDLGVRNHSEDLDTGFREDVLSLDVERLRIGLILFPSKVDNSRLLRLKCSPPPAFLVQSVLNNSFNTFLVTLYGEFHNLYGKAIDKCDCSYMTIDIHWTKSALKNRNKIGDKRERCVRPA
jgi:hypothetical protein